MDKYPVRVNGISFWVGEDVYLDEYSLSDVWAFFNNSQISSNYHVELINNPDYYWYSSYLEIIPDSEPHMTIFFTKDVDGDSYFWGNMEYLVDIFGFSGEYGQANEALEIEMGKILDAMGESDIIDTYNSDDNDFETLDVFFDEIGYYGYAAIVVLYIFIMLFDGGRILNGYFGGKISLEEGLAPILMFPGVWMLLLIITSEILGRGFMYVDLACYAGAFFFIAIPLIVIIDRRKKGKLEELDSLLEIP
ncbi:MAG: hypothetical protein KAJ33_07645 [Thermoplasmata archaeon]|nr:hypothetical protein [Thermoplasmata archaeon]